MTGSEHETDDVFGAQTPLRVDVFGYVIINLAVQSHSYYEKGYQEYIKMKIARANWRYTPAITSFMRVPSVWYCARRFVHIAGPPQTSQSSLSTSSFVYQIDVLSMGAGKKETTK